MAIEACQSNWGVDLSKAHRSLGSRLVILKKFLVITPGEERSSLSISLSHICPICSHALLLRSMQPCGSSSHMGPQQTTWALKGQRFNMKQKLWALAFVLALLKTQLNLFHSRVEGDGKLKTQGQISTELKLATSQSPMSGSLECFLHHLVEEPNFHQ